MPPELNSEATYFKSLHVMLPLRGGFQEGSGKRSPLRPFCGHTTELHDRLKGGAVLSFSL